MKESSSANPIPKKIALQLCAKISEKNRRRWFTQCWGCWKASKGDQAKMCVSSGPDYRGCRLVNARYDKNP